MREIKFRAWDPVTNKYFWPWPEGFNLFGEVTCFDCMGQQLSDTGRNTILGLTDLIIEQFTGLRDKNGREIYEGDIVSESMLDGPGIIQYIRAGYFFNDQKGPYLPLTDARLIFSVIGNIHENPELVNGPISE